MEKENAVATSKSSVASAQTAVAVEPFSSLDEVLSTSKSRRAGGTKIRPNVGYTLVDENIAKLRGQSIPEQKATILRIIRKALVQPGVKTVKDGTKNVPVVTEPELEKLVIAAVASKTLTTKQAPFHIFRYYRTSLKSDGVLRELDIPLAS